MQYFEELTQQQVHDILQDIGTDEESMKRDVKHLMDWLEKTPYLPSAKDEVFLSSALLRCKNSMEGVKHFLDYYYSRRSLGIDIFSCRDPCAEEIENSHNFVSTIPIPKLTPGGHRILIISYRPPPKDLPKGSSILSMWQMEQEVLMKSDKHKGIICIVDMKHFGIAAAALLLTEMKKLFDLVTKTTRTRYTETYVLNMLPAGQKFYDMMQPMMPGKMLGRVQIWGRKIEELAQVLPKSLLPSDFGGDERSVDELRDAWYKYVKQFQPWFKSEESIRADISKRPKDDFISQEFLSFGLTGSFRQISLD